MSETLKPIVDLRAVEYTWAEVSDGGMPGGVQAVTRIVHRIEFLREGETEWEAVPLTEHQGRPDWSRI